MKKCWSKEAQERPTFRELDITIGNLLEVGRDYLQLDMLADDLYIYVNDLEEKV